MIAISLTNSENEEMDSLILHNDQAYNDHLITHSRAMLNNGKLIIDGVLKNASIELKDSSGVQIAYISTDQLIIPIPSNYELENVTINIGADAGNLGFGILDRYKPEEELIYEISESYRSAEILTFSGYPNPIENTDTDFNVDVKLSSKQNINLGIYNQFGILVQQIYTGDVLGNTNYTYTISKSALLPGTYYLKLTGKSKNLFRRIIIK